MLGGHQRPADGGALLARLDGHLLDDLRREQVELGRAGDGAGSQHGGVERVGLGVEPHGTLQHTGVRPQHMGGRGRAGEGDAVLPVEAVEQAVELIGRRAHHLQRALGHQAGTDDEPHRGLGKVGGWRRRLHNGGHAGDEGGGQLLEHSPHREVEGVDLHLHAFAGGEDVHGREGVVPRQRLGGAVDRDGGVGQLAAGLAGVGQQHAGAAIDVDPRVAAGGSGAVRKVVERFLGVVAQQHLGDVSQDGGPLMEGQLPQRRPADGAPMLDGGGKVDAHRRQLSNHLAGGRVAQRPALTGRTVPSACCVALDPVHRAPSI